MSDQELEIIEPEPLLWPNGDPVDVDSIEAYAEDARVLAESPLDQGVVMTPDMVLEELGQVSKQAARMAKVIHLAEAFKRNAGRTLARAKADSRIRHASLPPTQQTAHIVLDTQLQQDEYDVASTAFEYARRVGNLLADYTSRVQTMGKQVELTYRHGGGQ